MVAAQCPFPAKIRKIPVGYKPMTSQIDLMCFTGKLTECYLSNFQFQLSTVSVCVFDINLSEFCTDGRVREFYLTD